MIAKKNETQTTIIQTNNSNNKQVTEEEFLDILKIVAPGTSIRAAIDGIVDAKKGGLIIIENEELYPLLDGGFKINAKFTPQRLIELSKLDGAIILSPDTKRIMYVNVTLVPDSKIPTKETGTRHKAAERTAKQIGTLAIAISERKNQIHLYYKNLKYFLREKSEVLRRATETLQILEKQRELFDANLERLNHFETFNDINVIQACKVIQKGKLMQKILESQEKNLIELGSEAAITKLRIKELMKDIEKETDLIIKDYTKVNLKKSKSLLSNLQYEELMDLDNIMSALNQDEFEATKSINGWRLLSKTNISEKEIAQLVNSLEWLPNILNAKKEKIERILGADKTEVFMRELERIRSK
jgi:diadenylate cyclase